MAKSKPEPEQFYAKDRAEWRAWLMKNHAGASGVWLVYYKKDSGKPRVAYDEAVEEALCFGWIDSRPNELDDERYMQLFSPRKPKSPWSKLNKQRVERLIADGLMTDAGLALIEASKQNGSWTAYDATEALTVPDDLREALHQIPAAETNFDAFSPTTKKQILWWVESAKRDETRQNRIASVVTSAQDNKNPIAYTRKKD